MQLIHKANIINLLVKLSVFAEESKTAKLKPLVLKRLKNQFQKRKTYFNSASSVQIFIYIIIQITFKKIVYFSTATFSIDSCLAWLTDFVLSGMDKGVHTVMIIINLQKAFATLDHKIILEKITCLGFKTFVINGLRVVCQVKHSLSLLMIFSWRLELSTVVFLRGLLWGHSCF